jgi:citrate lyase beta subunit
MSFQIQPSPVARLNRSQLFGPGSRPEIFEKMAKSEADVISLDLEDSVAPDDKEKARSNVIEAINNIDWENKATENGEGATAFKGRMVDIASIKQAEVLVQLANLIESDR